MASSAVAPRGETPSCSDGDCRVARQRSTMYAGDLRRDPDRRAPPARAAASSARPGHRPHARPRPGHAGRTRPRAGPACRFRRRGRAAARSASAGTGRAAPPAAGRCPRTRPGSAWRRPGTARAAAGACPSTDTCRSSIASSRAAWVFGGVRLISSASSRLVKTGPSPELELGRPRVVDQRAGHVARHQVGGELHPLALQRQRRGERPDQQRLGDAGHAFEQHVALAEQRDDAAR